MTAEKMLTPGVNEGRIITFGKEYATSQDCPASSSYKFSNAFIMCIHAQRYREGYKCQVYKLFVVIYNFKYLEIKMFSSRQHRLTHTGIMQQRLDSVLQEVNYPYTRYHVSPVEPVSESIVSPAPLSKNQSTSGVCSKRNLFFNIRFLIGCNWSTTPAGSSDGSRLYCNSRKHTATLKVRILLDKVTYGFSSPETLMAIHQHPCREDSPLCVPRWNVFAFERSLLA
jgi:hypothetical protein